MKSGSDEGVTIQRSAVASQRSFQPRHMRGVEQLRILFSQKLDSVNQNPFGPDRPDPQIEASHGFARW